jgi:hypothetical protein
MALGVDLLRRAVEPTRVDARIRSAAMASHTRKGVEPLRELRYAAGRRGRYDFNGNVKFNGNVNRAQLKLAATNSQAKKRAGCRRWETWRGTGRDSFCGSAMRRVLAFFGFLELR